MAAVLIIIVIFVVFMTIAQLAGMVPLWGYILIAVGIVGWWVGRKLFRYFGAPDRRPITKRGRLKKHEFDMEKLESRLMTEEHERDMEELARRYREEHGGKQ